MATTSNYGFVMPDSTDLVKDLPADFATFGNAVDGQMYTNANAAINKTLIDAKGDLIAGSAADTAARVAVGTDGQVLTADAASTAGVKWAAVNAGGMTLISETTASALASLSLSSIPSTYKHLLLQWDGILHSGTGSGFGIRLNNDSGTNYSVNANTFGALSSTDWGVNFSDTNTTTTGLDAGGNYYYPFGISCNTNDISSTPKGQMWIYNYSSTTKFKQFFMQYAYRTSANNNNYTSTSNGVYKSNSAISSIDIYRTAGTATFTNIANTSIRLYGVS